MDYRYRRTEKHIIDACIKLGEQKDVYSLTVTEIAKEAEINRITFYSHYENIDALFSHLEDIYIDEGFKKIAPFSDLVNNPEEYLKRNIETYQNYPIKIFDKSSKRVEFTQKAIQRIINEVIKECNNDDKDFKKKITFIVNGIYGVYKIYEIDENMIVMLSSYIRSVLKS